LCTIAIAIAKKKVIILDKDFSYYFDWMEL
jgi:hypothetical protein